VLLQCPRPIVDELENTDVKGKLTLASLCPPSSLELVSAGKELGPGSANKVRNENNESSLDGNCGGFELHMNPSVEALWLHYARTYHVDLVHNRLEAREARG
jgi:hypothetical protein